MASRRTDVSTRENWSDFWLEVRNRTSDGLKQPTVVFFEFAIVVLLGGTGIWISLLKLLPKLGGDVGDVVLSASTYAVATIGSGVASLWVGGRSILSVRIFTIAVAFITVIGALVANLLPSFPGCAVCASVCVVALSLWGWLLAKSDDEELSPRPNEATGGAVSVPLKGSLTGFQTGRES